MKQDLPLWQFAGFSLVSLGGTLLHFLYDWTHQSLWAAPFSGVNESTWEHMKLLYFPLFLFAVVQHFFFRQPNFWWVKLGGTFLGLVLIPVLFYTLSGVFGKTSAAVNIGIFFLSAAAVFLWEYPRLKRQSPSWGAGWIPLGILCLTGVLFVLFTFAPPRFPLFCDPLTGRYGILRS